MKQLRVLLVDDNASVRRLLSEVLEHRGYLVTALAGCDDAHAWLRDNQCDILLTDLGVGSMPDAEMIPRARSLAKEAKIIVISGCGVHRKDEITKAWGADGFLAKPFLSSELFLLIESLTIQHQTSSG